jgi:large subunit ribosomal protein L25
VFAAYRGYKPLDFIPRGYFAVDAGACRALHYFQASEAVMAEVTELKAWARERTGKGGARAIRRQGRIPGILYGDKQEPQNIAVDYRTISQQLTTGHFQSTIFVLDLDGSKTRVIPRGVQLDPVRDFPIHVDFMRLGKDASVTVDVPVRFHNEAASPGLKRGGVLNIVRHDIPVRCPADRIPDHFDVDLTGLEIGDSVHISAIAMPEGVRPTVADRDFTVATIVGRAAEEPVPGAAAVAEAVEAGAEAEAAPAEETEDKEKPKEREKKKE